MNAGPISVEPGPWLENRVMVTDLTWVPGIFEMTANGYTQRPGGNASIDELRRWVAKDIAAGKMGRDILWLVAQADLNGSTAFLLETHNFATGQREAFIVPYKRRFFGKKGTVTAEVSALPAPAAIAPP